MHILLDECLPRRLKRELIGHEAKSVPDMVWAGKTNGALLTVAQIDFDVFLTVDRNLSLQQDVNKFNIAIVVLVANSNKLSALQPLVPELLSLLAALVPGQVVRVGA